MPWARWRIASSFLSHMSDMDDDDEDDEDGATGTNDGGSQRSSPETAAVEDIEGLTVLETEQCILCQEATDVTSNRYFGLAVMVQPTATLR